MPILKALHKAGVTANQITVFAILLSFGIGVCFWLAKENKFLFLALPIGLFIRMALNALDGMMARTYNQQTKTGELLNELGDIISDLAIYFPLLIHLSKARYMVTLFLVLTVINEFAGLLGKVISSERRYDGPMGKSDRALIVGIYGLCGFFFDDLGSTPYLILPIVIGLLIVSTIKRAKKAVKS